MVQRRDRESSVDSPDDNQPASTRTAAAHRARPLIIDELAEHLKQFRLLRDTKSSDWLLSGLGGSGAVELDIAEEMATVEPLAHPERFAEGHAVAMHALEVLARNGSRSPSQLRAGPLTPALQFLVQRVIRYIVLRHQRHVVVAIRDLYSQRIGWCAPADPARTSLTRAWSDVAQAEPAYGARKGGVPSFLLGGAVVSSVSRAAQAGAETVGGSTWGLVAAWAASLALVVAAAWIILRGASVARRRIRVTMDRPLGGLWEIIGACGAPPRDGARSVAVVALLLTVVGWLLVPLLVPLLVALG